MLESLSIDRLKFYVNSYDCYKFDNCFQPFSTFEPIDQLDPKAISLALEIQKHLINTFHDKIEYQSI